MPARIAPAKAAALSALAAAQTPEALETWRIQFLGSKTVTGEMKALLAAIKDVPADQKKTYGAEVNAAVKEVEAAFTARQAQIGGGSAKPSGPLLDITEPGLAPALGREHVITQTIRELLDIFGRLGFEPVEGPEVEDERHNFDALNIPRVHPARDPNDNFYLTDPFQGTPKLLRSQTSTVQIRAMETRKPPLRIISPGRVYRPDEHDATHYSMFHQIEGLVVDTAPVTMSDLKTTLLQFAKAYWGPETEVKLVPSYFPFTEPSAEMYVKIVLGGETKWMEVGGCGMVDPAVFEAVGYNPDEVTGYAFGLGIERLAMRKYGIQDIRWLFENDVRFLRKF